MGLSPPASAGFDPSLGADTNQLLLEASRLPDTSVLFQPDHTESATPAPIPPVTQAPNPPQNLSSLTSPTSPEEPLYPSALGTRQSEETPSADTTPIPPQAIQPATGDKVIAHRVLELPPPPPPPDTPAPASSHEGASVPDTADTSVTPPEQKAEESTPPAELPPSAQAPSIEPIATGDIPSLATTPLQPLEEKRTVVPATQMPNLIQRIEPPAHATSLVPPAAAVLAPPAAETAAAKESAAPPKATPPPAIAAAKPAEKPTSKLSDQTRAILSMLPGSAEGIANQKASKSESLSVDRVSPEVEAALGDKVKVEKFEAVGLSIKVRRPGLDVNHELDRAYNALLGGDSASAISIYQDILSTEPKNQDALFGLAATYHRQGQIDKARPLYGMLLKLNPNHREGLNNFLVLVTDESPEDALPELERLEQRNRDFSPIPAQLATVLDKLGYADQAREKMLRAIDLAPNNMTYKYNLAIMLDKQGKSADAAALYRLLIEAALRGESVPASADAMQKRLNYLSAAMHQQASGS